MMPPKYELRLLREPKRNVGFIASVGHIDGHVFASGGTHGRSTWLHADDGVSFVLRNTPEALGLRGLFIERLDRIFVCGEFGAIAVTTDQGDTWESLSSQISCCVYRIVRAGDALLASSDKGLHISRNDGASWECIYTTRRRLLGLYVDGHTVYGWGADKELLVYLPEGRCTKIPLPTTHTLTGMLRTPMRNMMLCGDGGQLFRSEDNGESWSAIPHQHKGDFEDIAVVQGRILVVGSNGTLLCSGDDGRSFYALKTDTQQTLWSLCPTPDGAYIGGAHGMVMHISLGLRTSKPRSSREPK